MPVFKKTVKIGKGHTNIRDVGGINLYDGLWHHIVATTTAAGGTELFVDGLSRATGAGPANLTTGNPAQNLLWIGNNPQGGANRMWDGTVDDAAMWETVLTAADVTQIYQAGLAGTSLGAIPEPSTGILGGLAGLLLIVRRRR